MKVIMTGGGTGGHVNPAIAIANKIKECEPDSDISFVGTSRGIENRLVPQAGYPLYHIEIQGLKRSISFENLKTAGLMITSLPKARNYLHEKKPDIVIGTGGYACWPVVFAAYELGIPAVLHESNALPGVTVHMLEGRVRRIYVNFEESIALLKHPEKALRVGNPLREEFFTLDKKTSRKNLGYEGRYDKIILSCGGSLGAEPINDSILEVMRNYSSAHPEILHIHSTGSNDHGVTREKFNALGLDKFDNIKLMDYIYDMPQQMSAADVVINRAGAMTLSELAAQSKPCILIPSPYVADNHQYKNAKALEDRGGAVLIEEKNLSSEGLINAISDILDNSDVSEKMSKAISSLSVKGCTELIYKDIRENILK